MIRYILNFCTLRFIYVKYFKCNPIHHNSTFYILNFTFFNECSVLTTMNMLVTGIFKSVMNTRTKNPSEL